MAIERLTAAYRLGSPEGCLTAHLLHAGELEQSGAGAAQVLHHRLAAGLIALRMEWEQIDAVVAEISATARPEQPPTFAEVVETLEDEDGLAFRELLDTLPGRGRDGDQALAELWRRAGAGGRPGVLDVPVPPTREIPSGFWETLPPSVRRALALEGDEMDAALRRALQRLPEQEARAVLSRLHDAGILGGMSEEGRDRVVEGFQAFLKGVVSVAMGDDAPRAELEQLLPELERAGWHITVPVFQIWEGRRDEAGLCAGLDPASARLVKQILVLILEAENDGAEAGSPDKYVTSNSTTGKTMENDDSEAGAPDESSRPEVVTIEPEPLNPGDVNPAPAKRLVDISDPASLTAEQRALLDTMPPLLRDVFALDGADFGVVLGLILATMPAGDAMRWMRDLLGTGMVGVGEEVTAEDALEHLDPFLFDIAQAAMGRDDLRPGLEDYLRALEHVGMQITDAVFRIWAGERDPASLTAGLGPANALLVNRILEHLNREIV